MKMTDKSHLTPLARTVSAVMRNPLNIISSVFLWLMLLMICLLDFRCTFFALPILVFELVSVIVSTRAAKLQKGRFGIGTVKFSAIFGLIFALLFLALLVVTEYFELFELKHSFFDTSFSDLNMPLNFLNIKFDSTMVMALSLVFLYLSKTVYTCSISMILKKNTPNRKALLISVLLSCLSFAVFCAAVLNISWLITVYSYNINRILCLSLFILGTVSAVTFLALNIYTYTKMRKNSHAI